MAAKLTPGARGRQVLPGIPGRGVALGSRAPYIPRMQPPLIGITADAESPGGYSNKPWYALRENYCSVVHDAGGLAMVLPHEPALIEAYLARIDGLLISGGAFDVDPTLFGAESRHASVITKDRRTQFELGITTGAMARDLPVLGICGGQQLMHVALGGTLYQHIPDEVADALAHEQPNPRDEPGHSVAVTPGTLLHRIVECNALEVNSAHHQAAKDIGEGVVVNAVAPDGVIEGIEDPRRRFCLGVQWHPEYLVDAGDAKIIAAFVAAAGANAESS